MITEPAPTELMQEELYRMAEYLESQRDELIHIHKQTLRKTIFSNHIQLHPADMERLAVWETDAMINDIRNSFKETWQHGVELCNAGLSVQTVFEFMHIQGDFLINYVGQADSVQLTNLSRHRFKLVEGYVAERENIIIQEQETIHKAFEGAVRHANLEVQKSQAQLQIETEKGHRQTIIIQEEERRRISRELHDDAGQNMVRLRLSLENLNGMLPDDSALKEELNKAMLLTNSAMEKIRTVAYHLRPPMLDMLGLNLALKQMCLDFCDQSNLIVGYQGIETPLLKDEISISIYRITQEALTNVVKHAGAKHAWIRLQCTRNLIKLSITDDGHGFDPQSIKTGIGMVSMLERCRLLKGTMQVLPTQGRSTVLKFSFPIDLKI
ncbi:MAG: sensor histidine kinase [Chloroflexota bacterium]